MKAEKIPMALEPPPTQATTASGSRPAICEDLGAGLVADDRLEVAHHGRVGVRPGHRADDVVGVADVGDPVADGLVHRVLERARARLHRDDPRPEQLHAEDVERLPLHVERAHVDVAGHAEEGRGGGGGHAVLAGAGLGDDAPLAHAARQQHLPQRVVDLVRAGVAEVLALQQRCGSRPASAPMRSASPSGVGRPAKRVSSRVSSSAKAGSRRACVPGRLELVERRDQRLGDEAAAVGAEVAARRREGSWEAHLADGGDEAGHPVGVLHAG